VGLLKLEANLADIVSMQRQAIGVLVLLLVLPGCREAQVKSTGSSALASSKVVQVDGATAAFPIAQKVIAEFTALHPDMAVTIGLSGTGVGFQKFCSGDNDVLEASRPIKPAEEDACGRKDIRYIELPFAYDAIAIVVNPNNSWVNSMTIAELKAAWDVNSQAKVLTWKDIRPDWPNADIHLFGPGLDSGAFDYFTAAVNGAEGVGRGDYTASENEEVLVNGIAGDPLALGYLSSGYYAEHRDVLKVIAIADERTGPGPTTAVLPSTETILNGTYPRLSRPLFLYVNLDRLSRPEVVQFTEFYLRNVPRIAAEIHCVPLPGRAYALALGRLHNRTAGSIFNEDVRIGTRMEQLVHLQETEVPH
jgi:phosphate transport system substrate-binding protein